MANKDLEARFAALREKAATHHSELDLSLVVGGVHIEELYQVHRIYDEGTTLDSQLTAMARLLDDPRTEAVATGITKLKESEALGDLVANLIKARASDYKTALDGLHSITDVDPADKDSWQASLAIVARVLADGKDLKDAETPPNPAADKAAGIYREGIDTNPEAEANWVDPEAPAEDTAEPTAEEGTPTPE